MREVAGRVGRSGTFVMLVAMVFGVGGWAAPAEAGWMVGQPQKAAPTQLGDEGPPARTVTDPLEAMQARMMMEERHKRLVSDTGRLLQMSMELKAAIDKSNSDEMSLAVIQKAGEIEKLAHKMQGRMK